MSRHRNIRNYNYDEELEYDVYGHSVEDDIISPEASQYLSIYSRTGNSREIEEEMDDLDESDSTKPRRDSEDYELPELNDTDKAKLLSCMEEIRNIIGDTVSDKRMVDTIMDNNYDLQKSLDYLLNEPAKPKPVEKHKLPGETLEKGITDLLLGKVQSQQQPSTITVNVTPVVASKSNVTRGFNVSSPTSPTMRSPVSSGRTSPEANDELKLGRNHKEINRNAKELYEKERGDNKQQIHMVVIGHVDAGKSTLMGHLLFDLGHVSQRVMHKHEQESKKIGKQSFVYAWVLDETGEERERGITMDVGCSRFETDTKQVTLLDAPGHKDFIPNMISGANQADVALLVVDATRGEFETGFEQGGQTREHALLVRSLGVNQLCVVVNKLDTVGWAKERFDEIVAKLKIFLKQAGFKDSDLNYIPCSGLSGENLVKPPTDPELLKWYNGPTLLTIIDNFKTPERAIDKPFRMSVNDVYKGTGSGFCISGRIESGHLCVNDKILVCPSKEQAQVKHITVDELPCNTVFAGDQVSVTLSGIDSANVSVGYILSDLYHPVPLATKIKARIVVFNIKTPITLGYPVLMHHQSLIEPVTITKLKAQLHKGTGEIIKKNPRCLGNNSCALIEISFSRAICMEKYSDNKDLGRIMLRVDGITIAAGLITDIIFKQNN
jgi:elongation factor 1 alpha-like protein